MLLVASYVFYGWWDWRFLFLLFISTLTDFVIAAQMAKCGENRPRVKKIWLLVSLTTNLGILGFFKYFNFFAESVERIMTPFGLQPDFVTLNILLPVGISFYTFQTMAYTIDVYRGRETPCRNFIDFALYVAFFPQLVAGPIERSTNLIPQIAKPRFVDRAMIYSACQLILMGYFKKIFIADGVAPMVNLCFGNADQYGGKTLLVGAYLFALQIYGDFSGYTDIARGVSRLFGIELMLNFRQPYLSTSITDFWRRWHISLSAWLRDYLYIPLGGNRKGKVRTYTNNMTTMLLGGLWHGAAMTFIVWGGLHGLYLAVHKWILGDRKAKEWTPWDESCRTVRERVFLWIKWGLCVFATFNLVCLAWVFFRAESCMDALYYIKQVFRGGDHGFEVLAGTYLYGIAVLFMDLSCAVQKSEVPFTEKWHPVLRAAGYASILYLIIFIGENSAQPFIYFQF